MSERIANLFAQSPTATRATTRSVWCPPTETAIPLDSLILAAHHGSGSSIGLLSYDPSREKQSPIGEVNYASGGNENDPLDWCLACLVGKATALTAFAEQSSPQTIQLYCGEMPRGQLKAFAIDESQHADDSKSLFQRGMAWAEWMLGFRPFRIEIRRDEQSLGHIDVPFAPSTTNATFAWCRPGQNDIPIFASRHANVQHRATSPRGDADFLLADEALSLSEEDREVCILLQLLFRLHFFSLGIEIS
ncbi:hypothetical protein AB1L30_14345 [Bremerella sp. JC817]|uniref:hypothetical protein n=1 Tax=Bremerella sp. JC817 TaxID=3231756 RepID=UPI003457D674